LESFLFSAKRNALSIASRERLRRGSEDKKVDQG
jgi:hypothetical protein